MIFFNELFFNTKTWNETKFLKENRILQQKCMVPQSREFREIFGETETMKMVPRRDQSRGLESRLQALLYTWSDLMIFF